MSYEGPTLIVAGWPKQLSPHERSGWLVLTAMGIARGTVSNGLTVATALAPTFTERTPRTRLKIPSMGFVWLTETDPLPENVIVGAPSAPLPLADCRARAEA